MAETLPYTELDVWQQARVLVRVVYELSKRFPRDEQFGLQNQIRRAAVSIPSNIAEGCGRNRSKDSTQFFFIARGSLYEVETQLILANDVGYITEEELTKALEQLGRCKRLINGFINYFQKLTNNDQPTTINEIIEQYGNGSTN